MTYDIRQSSTIYFGITRIPSSCRNKGAGTSRVPNLGEGHSRGTLELVEGGGWVVGVTVWVLQAVEGGTLVPGQRDAVLDA